MDWRARVTVYTINYQTHEHLTKAPTSVMYVIAEFAARHTRLMWEELAIAYVQIGKYFS